VAVFFVVPTLISLFCVGCAFTFLLCFVFACACAYPLDIVYKGGWSCHWTSLRHFPHWAIPNSGILEFLLNSRMHGLCFGLCRWLSSCGTAFRVPSEFFVDIALDILTSWYLIVQKGCHPNFSKESRIFSSFHFQSAIRLRPFKTPST